MKNFIPQGYVSGAQDELFDRESDMEISWYCLSDPYKNKQIPETNASR